ncbi:MAG TPA: magnesium/cobalt transporter CorA [Acidimicrobiia bacterium]|nr:magnesium/cobalt transporter CorA [Acidimicrobiia bacterium]
MIVDSALYVNGQRIEGRLALEHVPAACQRPDSFIWLGLHEPTEEEFEAVRSAFDLHELAVEDAVKAHQRPKLEVYDESLFLVLKTARYLDAAETVDFGEIQIFVGDHFLVHVRHGEATALASVRRAVEARDDLLRCGPGAVLHAIVDHVVDDYGPVVTGLDKDIREVELEVFTEGVDNPVERIYKLKREVLELRQAVLPLEDALDALHTRKYEPIHEDIREYFRDVHDHALKVEEQVNTFSDLLTSILSANLTRVSVRQNEDMRKISAWVAIAAVPTMVAGIYGMNFEHMPELGWVAGYPLILALMAGACATLYRYFRRSGWL